MRVTISEMGRSWTFTNREGKETNHTFTEIANNDSNVQFTNNRTSVTAYVRMDGVLVLQGRDKVAFLAQENWDKKLVCPECFGRTDLGQSACRHCDHEFV